MRSVFDAWLKPWRPSPRHSAQAEADRLLAIWGETAFHVARSLAVREEAGLLHTASPGFWAHVGREIVSRTGARERAVFGTDLVIS